MGICSEPQLTANDFNEGFLYDQRVQNKIAKKNTYGKNKDSRVRAQFDRFRMREVRKHGSGDKTVKETHQNAASDGENETLGADAGRLPEKFAIVDGIQNEGGGN